MTPPTAADVAIMRGPLRAAKTAPVAAPDMIPFHGSSLPRIATNVQSKDEKRAPHIPKFPPSTGARIFTADSAPASRAPFGEFRTPLMVCQTVPAGDRIAAKQHVAVTVGNSHNAQITVRRETRLYNKEIL